MINIGLWFDYVVVYYVIFLFIEVGVSLMVYILFYGVVSYFYGFVYGVDKVGIDKMNFDMVCDLVEIDVVSVVLWLGLILLDVLKNLLEEYFIDELKVCLVYFELFEFIGEIIE